MNRRDVFKGGFGAAATAVEIHQRMVQDPSRMPQYPPQLPVPTDPTDLIKSAMMKAAEQEACRQETLITRAQQRLNRLRSTSEAWREAMQEKYLREKQAIWTRLDEARKFIFG